MDQQEEQKRKGISMIIFAVILGLVGGTFFVVTLYTGIKNLNDSMIRFKVPGSKEIELKGTGEYTIFHEYRSTFDGEIYNSGDNVSNLLVTVMEKSSGTEIPLSPPSGRTTYNIGGQAGYSLFNFRVTTPGVYIFTGQYRDGEGSEVILSVAYKMGTLLMTTIGSSILILFITIGVSVTIFVMGLVKVTKKDKNTVSDNNQYYGG